MARSAPAPSRPRGSRWTSPRTRPGGDRPPAAARRTHLRRALLVRERYLGTADLFRVAPLTAGETLWGKYLGHFAIGGVLAAVLVAASVFALGVPMEGSWWQLGVSVAGVIVASLGWGMVLSSLVDTDAQAVQASMIALLVSIFFSGFMLSLDRLARGAPGGLVDPRHPRDSALQDVMFRGVQPSLVTWGSLAALAVGLAAIAYLGLRRRCAT